jgi:hypothetical protein
MPLFIYLCFAFGAGLIVGAVVGRTEMLRSLGMTWTDYFHRLKQ